MLLVLLLFIVVPIVEIYVIIQVGQEIGALWTIAILIADSLIGARLLSWQGRAAWRRLQEALEAGRIPHREILDGVMIVVGGTLLLTPGFITDLFGLVLLIPPTRALVRRALVASLLRRGAASRVLYFGGGRVRDWRSGAKPPPRRFEQPDEPAEPVPPSEPHAPDQGPPRQLPSG